ncbi:tyrosine-type recombinase/integrase [Georgenia sp. AZ-5]|uniref:tyrosine-type recombinase/integrase n=1 Tax=Georgenia sp. AZ-5 TaxID=3367526 RepID=UPI003754AE16
MAANPIPKKRRDGTTAWSLPFRLHKGGKVTSETFDSRDEAVKFGRLVDRYGGEEARRRRTLHTESPAEIPTLTEALAAHLTRLGASATPGTIYGYDGMARRTFLPRLGDLPVDAITEDDVAGWIAWQRQQETVHSQRARARARAETRPEPAPVLYADRSLQKAQSLLSSVLEGCVRRYGLSVNPAKGAKLPHDRPGEEMVFLSPEEFTRLHAHIPARHQPFVLFLYATGARWGEATALTVGDVDLDAAQPVVHIAKAWKKDARGRVYLGTVKGGGRGRTVTLPPALVPVLRPLLDRPADALLFPAPHGGRLGSDFHKRVWNPAVTAANLGKRPPRIHDLRHSHVAGLIGHGVPLTVIQRRLGHKSISITSDTYGHLLPEVSAGAALAAGALLAQALPEIEPAA